MALAKTNKVSVVTRSLGEDIWIGLLEFGQSVGSLLKRNRWT